MWLTIPPSIEEVVPPMERCYPRKKLADIQHKVMMQNRGRFLELSDIVWRRIGAVWWLSPGFGSEFCTVSIISSMDIGKFSLKPNFVICRKRKILHFANTPICKMGKITILPGFLLANLT